MSDLYQAFHRHFEVVAANTPCLIETAYRLRYQVYCLEKPYEDAQAFPQQMEHDEFDLHSVHSLVKCHKSGNYTGLVRLVLPNPVNPDAHLPMEKFCHARTKGRGVDLSHVPRESIAEISRFSISKALRQHCAAKGDIPPLDSKVAREDRMGPQDDVKPSQLLPHITLGLFAGIVRMSAQHGISHWLAVMEPTLLRFLTRYGIHFQPTGPLVNYHGMRQPAVAEIDTVLSGIHAQRRDVWEIITDYGRIWPLGDTPKQALSR